MNKLVMFVKGILGKSFCWGIMVASFTWIVTILLYFHLTKESLNNTRLSQPLNQGPTYKTNSNIPIIANQQNTNIENSITLEQTSTKHSINPLVSKFAFIQRLGNINKYGIINNLDDQHIRDLGYKNHAFNALVSNNIGLKRDIPDTRHKICQKQVYDEELPTSSIVMCYYNEHKMTLLRSIKTILDRTPTNYLKEIILVDDYSDASDLTSGLIEEIHKFDIEKKVRLLRNTQREGLIRARVIGARNSTGDVLVFLDSHIEVNKDWIEPLLNIVKHENSTLAVPVIDIINADTFQYTPSPLVRGGFNWGLHFKWENLPDGTLKDENSFSGPFKSPTMAGGLFAVDRRYFSHIGEYDMGMDIWGGENLEISFRVWQCGGSIKIMPCSRVGHIFRKRRPYSSPEGVNTMLKNSLRLAYVWMDEYKDYYIKHENIARFFDYGDITERIQLREKLKCSNFTWYMHNVYPELDLPGEHKKASKGSKYVFQPWHSRKRKYTGSFLMRLSGTNLCAAVVGPKVNGFYKKGSTINLQTCMKSKNQIWYETEKSEIILDKLLCLEASLSSNYAYPVVGKCHEMLGDQQWKHTSSDSSPIYNMATGTCIRATEAAEGATLKLDLCTKNVPNSWDIISME